jgi:hypothetical protein
MKLNEILDSKIQYKIDKETDEDFHTSALINGRKILFKAEYHDTTEDWLVNFAELDEKNIPRVSKTNSGGELKVFAMVKECMMELIKRYSPVQIRFSASKESSSDNRAKLYHALINKFKVSGYTLTTRKSEGSETFRLTKELK